MTTCSAFAESYSTERLKTLTVWSQFGESDLQFRPEPRARTPLEHLVHQCMSEDGWMRTMLGIDVGLSVLPAEETRLGFLETYEAASAARLAILAAKPDSWFSETTRFFDTDRSRAWVLIRRLTHSAHHRGQLSTYLRLLGRSLYSTYGPTADTGGLPVKGARVIYRYPTTEALLAGERQGGLRPPLPGPGDESPTERPAR
ncbi:MAG: DinB family protein [Gemmatimonadota bacterium]